MDSKAHILQKSHALFMRYGIKSVTMDDIARELAVSKKTLYQFFENKADLLQQIANENMEKDKAVMAKALTDSKNAIDEFLHMARYITNEISQISPTALYDMQKYYPEIWQSFQDFSESQIFDNIKLNLERGIREGIYRPEIDSDIIAKLYVSKTNCVIDEESFPSKKYDKVKLFKQFFTYHVYGIATPKGLKLLEKHFSE